MMSNTSPSAVLGLRITKIQMIIPSSFKKTEPKEEKEEEKENEEEEELFEDESDFSSSNSNKKLPKIFQRLLMGKNDDQN